MDYAAPASAGEYGIGSGIRHIKRDARPTMPAVMNNVRSPRCNVLTPPKTAPAAKARHIEPSAIARAASFLDAGSYNIALAAEKAPRRFPVVIPVLNVTSPM